MKVELNLFNSHFLTLKIMKFLMLALILGPRMKNKIN